jgi:hypothetical protein
LKLQLKLQLHRDLQQPLPVGKRDLQELWKRCDGCLYGFLAGVNGRKGQYGTAKLTELLEAFKAKMATD